MRRWVLDVLHEAGVDTAVFGAGSVRGASTSKALWAGAPLALVLEHGGWARTSTFAKYYHRPIVTRAGMAEFVMGAPPR